MSIVLPLGARFDPPTADNRPSMGQNAPPKNRRIQSNRPASHHPLLPQRVLGTKQPKAPVLLHRVLWPSRCDGAAVRLWRAAMPERSARRAGFGRSAASLPADWSNVCRTWWSRGDRVSVSGGRRVGSHVGMAAMRTMGSLRHWKNACAVSSLVHRYLRFGCRCSSRRAETIIAFRAPHLF